MSSLNERNNVDDNIIDIDDYTQLPINPDQLLFFNEYDENVWILDGPLIEDKINFFWEYSTTGIEKFFYIKYLISSCTIKKEIDCNFFTIDIHPYILKKYIDFKNESSTLMWCNSIPYQMLRSLKILIGTFFEYLYSDMNQKMFNGVSKKDKTIFFLQNMKIEHLKVIVDYISNFIANNMCSHIRECVVSNKKLIPRTIKFKNIDIYDVLVKSPIELKDILQKSDQIYLLLTALTISPRKIKANIPSFKKIFNF